MSDILATAGSSNNNLNQGGGAKADSNDPPLRQGKWTKEEEDYVNCLIDEFKTGMIPLAEGTSLRTFLSNMLNCHPMRISKKFVGSNYNGKQVYVRRTGNNRLSNDEVRSRRAKLCDLERKFLAKIASNGGTLGANTPSAQNTLPTPHASLAVSMNNLGSSSSQQMQANPSLHNLQNHGVSISSSGVELRALNTAAAQQQSNNSPRPSTGDFPRSITTHEVPLKAAPQSSSAASGGNNGGGGNGNNNNLQNLFQELMANNGGNAVEAFQVIQQQMQQQSSHASQHQSSKTNVNSKAAAAGRALLQSGGGLGLGLDSKKPASRGGHHQQQHQQQRSKPLESFSSAELAAELRKRSSLKDLMSSLGGNRKSSLANLQDSLQQAAQGNTHAFSSLMRNSSLDMSNLIERQGSIDSLSNLAVRSRLQSLQSLGSLMDPIDTSNLSAGMNKNWTPSLHNSNSASGLASKVSTDNIGTFRRTANDLMESLGRGSLGNFGSSSQSNANAIRSSGINLANLLNNDDALRRLQESAPSSLQANFAFSSSQDNSSQQQQQQQQQDDSCIAQFLLQKKLAGAQQQQQKSGNDGAHQFLMNAAATSASLNNNNNSGNMDPFMSSILASLKPSGNDGSNGGQEDAMESLKRKFFGQEGLVAAAAQAQEEQRRNKPFR